MDPGGNTPPTPLTPTEYKGGDTLNLATHANEPLKTTKPFGV